MSKDQTSDLNKHQTPNTKYQKQSMPFILFAMKI